MKDAHLPLISEAELRCALKHALQDALTEDDVLLEEMGIENGRARIDLAVITHHLAGYEIKSDFDNPLRLYNQIHAYNRVFDEIYLVTGASIGQSFVSMVPSWWGILFADREDDGTITLVEYRTPIYNANKDPISLLELLKREELLQLLANADPTTKLTRATRSTLLECLANYMTIADITSQVTRCIKARTTALYRAR